MVNYARLVCALMYKGRIFTFWKLKLLSIAKQMFVISDDLLRRAVSSCESSLACNEFFDACMASEKSMCENKQRRRWRSASNPNGFTS